jgi:hypothetical protein
LPIGSASGNAAEIRNADFYFGIISGHFFMSMTIEDIINIEEIKKLRSLYSHYFDAQDLDKLCALFTEDAKCEWDEDHIVKTSIPWVQ